MKVISNVVHARSMGRAFANDPDLALPERPRLIPELLVCPIGENGVAFVGGANTEVIRGRSARPLLSQLLPLLDGTRSPGQISEDLPDLPAPALHDALSLLFSRGLLEDGAATGTHGRPDLLSFLGRYNDVTRRNRSRDEAYGRLARARVCIVGRPDLGDLLRDQLAASGLTPSEEQLAGGPHEQFGIVVSVGDEPVEAGRISDLAQSSSGVFLIRLGAGEAHMGPMLMAGATACSACLSRTHPHPEGAPDPLHAELWLSLAAQQVLLEVAGVTSTIIHRGLHRWTVTAAGSMAYESRLAPRMPGCAQCGIAGAAWSPEDPRLLPWAYHVSSSLTRRSAISSKEHQGHYLAANIDLAAAREVLLCGSTPIALPASGIGSAPRERAVTPRRLSIGDLSALLARTAGETNAAAGRRRVAPTGGDLGSVRLWVLVRNVDGLERGAYLYEPSDHSLRFRATFEDVELGERLASGDLPDCLVLAAADVAKCSRKYRAFAYRLVHFDAGVATAYAHAVSRALGLRVREYPDFDLELPEAFGVARRWEHPMPTVALGVWVDGGQEAAMRRRPAPLRPEDYSAHVVGRMMDAAILPGPAATPADKPTLASLDEILLARRATRAFSPAPVAATTISALVAAAEDALATRQAAGAPPSFVRPLVLLGEDGDGLPSGVYERVGDRLARRGPFSRDLAAECTLQMALAAAPVALVMVTDLRAALTTRSARGYCEQAIHAGAAIGSAWLAATSHGLVGTAAGGVIPDGLRRVGGLDGFNQCPLIGLHVGLPVGAG